MPNAVGKGKKPLSEVMEYDPTHHMAIGQWRVKKQKKTAK